MTSVYYEYLLDMNDIVELAKVSPAVDDWYKKIGHQFDPSSIMSVDTFLGYMADYSVTELSYSSDQAQRYIGEGSYLHAIANNHSKSDSVSLHFSDGGALFAVMPKDFKYFASANINGTASIDSIADEDEKDRFKKISSLIGNLDPETKSAVQNYINSVVLSGNPEDISLTSHLTDFLDGTHVSATGPIQELNPKNGKMLP